MGATRLAEDMVRDPGVRRSWMLRLQRPANLFQPHNDTGPDRYPEVFSYLGSHISDGPDVHLLSFACSIGDEVFSLRRYSAEAVVTGIDISRGNIADCRRRQRTHGDERMIFVRAGSAECEPADFYDAVLCMAVLRHGDLGLRPVESCDHRIAFDGFDRTVGQLAACLKRGGYLVIEHSNFRFCDSPRAADFEVVGTREQPTGERPTPLFGPDNRLLDDQSYREVIFRRVR